METVLTYTAGLTDRVWGVKQIVEALSNGLLRSVGAAADVQCCTQSNCPNPEYCWSQCGGCDCGCGPCLGAGGYNNYFGCTSWGCRELNCKTYFGYCCI